MGVVTMLTAMKPPRCLSAMLSTLLLSVAVLVRLSPQTVDKPTGKFCRPYFSNTPKRPINVNEHLFTYYILVYTTLICNE